MALQALRRVMMVVARGLPLLPILPSHQPAVQIKVRLIYRKRSCESWSGDIERSFNSESKCRCDCQEKTNANDNQKYFYVSVSYMWIIATAIRASVRIVEDWFFTIFAG